MIRCSKLYPLPRFECPILVASVGAGPASTSTWGGPDRDLDGAGGGDNQERRKQAWGQRGLCKASWHGFIQVTDVGDSVSIGGESRSIGVNIPLPRP